MNELYHYGVKGQKWGVRRYQNLDGTLTSAGKRHYGQLRTLNKVNTELTDDEIRLFNGQNEDEKPARDSKKQNVDYIQWAEKYPEAYQFVADKGSIVLANTVDKDGGYWEIGWATAPSARGTGITQANIKKAIEHIRKVSDLPIDAAIDVTNTRSIRTAEKAGFKKHKLEWDYNGHHYQNYRYKG